MHIHSHSLVLTYWDTSSATNTATALFRQQPFNGALTTVLPRQNLAGTIMVLAGCWPKNALGEPELAYCLSAGWRLCSAAAAEVPLRARECERLLLGIDTPFYTCIHNNVPGISHSSSVNARKIWRLFL